MYMYMYMYIYVYIYIYRERERQTDTHTHTHTHKAKIFPPSHHACNRTTSTSTLVPSHRASRGDRGDKI